MYVGDLTNWAHRRRLRGLSGTISSSPNPSESITQFIRLREKYRTNTTLGSAMEVAAKLRDVAYSAIKSIEKDGPGWIKTHIFRVDTSALETAKKNLNEAYWKLRWHFDEASKLSNQAVRSGRNYEINTVLYPHRWDLWEWAEKAAIEAGGSAEGIAYLDTVLSVKQLGVDVKDSAVELQEKVDKAIDKYINPPETPWWVWLLGSVAIVGGVVLIKKLRHRNDTLRRTS